MTQDDSTRAQLQGQVNDLQAEVATGRSSIRELEAQAALDHVLIEELQSRGEIERVETEGLRVALATCRRIGVAIGIVMTTRRVDVGEAFEILTRVSQNTNRKLRDVADDVMLTGEVPTFPTKGGADPPRR